MHEYRIRLIADVITGKLDVREAAAQLPEEIGDDDLDDADDEVEVNEVDETELDEEPVEVE